MIVWSEFVSTVVVLWLGKFSVLKYFHIPSNVRKLNAWDLLYCGIFRTLFICTKFFKANNWICEYFLMWSIFKLQLISDDWSGLWFLGGSNLCFVSSNVLSLASCNCLQSHCCMWEKFLADYKYFIITEEVQNFMWGNFLQFFKLNCCQVFCPAKEPNKFCSLM